MLFIITHLQTTNLIKKDLNKVYNYSGSYTEAYNRSIIIKLDSKQ
jgi:hypothetical protein